jgi:hypothetical protein
VRESKHVLFPDTEQNESAPPNPRLLSSAEEDLIGNILHVPSRADLGIALAAMPAEESKAGASREPGPVPSLTPHADERRRRKSLAGYSELIVRNILVATTAGTAQRCESVASTSSSRFQRASAG